MSSPSPVLESKDGIVTSEASSPLLKSNDNLPKQFDIKLEKLKIIAHQPVILPNCLLVPEEFKAAELIFWSLDASMEQIMNNNGKPVLVTNERSNELSVRYVVSSFL
ncbi:unnamed protein product [Cuscuta epithymum]|uniref:Uncharacterized protein n=1 Tax=Cuscuta epithymum TaxID=186058 RepID=A0AAV0CZF5_9ASTE|nr:unnamed protein product [Cuscuta epithymum]